MIARVLGGTAVQWLAKDKYEPSRYWTVVTPTIFGGNPAWAPFSLGFPYAHFPYGFDVTPD